jgi:hypothetical protein
MFVLYEKRFIYEPPKQIKIIDRYYWRFFPPRQKCFVYNFNQFTAHKCPMFCGKLLESLYVHAKTSSKWGVKKSFHNYLGYRVCAAAAPKRLTIPLTAWMALNNGRV